MSNLFGSLAATIGALSVEEMKRIAWNNAAVVLGTNLKRDCDGRWIAYDEYGQYSARGWQVDHVVPKVLGGLDIPANLRARHWFGNSSAGGRTASLLKQLTP